MRGNEFGRADLSPLALASRRGPRGGGRARVLAVVVAASTAAAGLALQGSEPALRRFEFNEPHMGTTVRLVLYAGAEEAAHEAARAAFARVAALDARLSDYRSDSELSRLGGRAGRGPVAVSDDLRAVLSAALELSRRSDGAFDATAGALTRLWRRARRLSELPARDDVERAREASGHRRIRLDAAAGTVTVTAPGLRFDVGGIAKGFAGDEALGVLGARGVPRALVTIGGDVVAGAPPPDRRAWRVDVAALDAARGPRESLDLAGAAVSTSGDAEQWMTAGGVRYSHVIDPRSGWPVTGHTSVTVVARRGIDADSLSTALAVLDQESGEALLEGVPGAAALWQWQAADGTVAVRHSRRWGTVAGGAETRTRNSNP